MSNARILADLMGTSTTVPSSKLSLGAGDLPSGSVLQVVSKEVTDIQSYTGNMTLNSNFDLSITPSSTSNKILITYTIPLSYNSSSAYNGVGAQLRRGSTILGSFTSSNRGELTFTGTSGEGFNLGTSTRTMIDSPATTSAITYRMYFGATDGTGGVIVNRTWDSGDSSDRTVSSSTLVLMEIAG